MDNQALVALLAQLPLVGAFFFALQKKWIYIGTNVTQLLEENDQQIADRQKQIETLATFNADRIKEIKAEHQVELAAANARADREREDRIAADERTAKMAVSLTEATSVMERSVALHEQAALGAGNAARPRRTTR
jgi:hypothetical protein